MTSATFDFSADLPFLDAYNARLAPGSEYRLRSEVAPLLYEGRLGAPVTWLLSNPSYVTTPGYGFNHPPPVVDGWPLQSLAPAYRNGYGQWTWQRLRELREALGPELVSNNVLALQLCPWASENFAPKLKLPSRAYTRELALHQLAAGSHFVLVRSVAAWFELVPELAGAKLARTASQRSAHLSKGNLKSYWEGVLRAVRGC
ncbi:MULTISPECIES: hypothetical protein [unclassified Variovorax]|uniref:hypothetical protein n=1 Tax=unclassified Variovorax TaxID=663243 RepID=UPI000839073F|nr:MULTISPECIES: hypothetical protein [unclassified Variovorax]PNG50357.1 hypothetical protein CHC06_05980 [Variovorax sp. B2]PNG51230.1 hypothetical protein CHC07_05886 [Variovorax sp. B4]VTV17463.1 hypothetical protein WDL1P1_00407 [Variovorax sp. WDL1]